MVRARAKTAKAAALPRSKSVNAGPAATTGPATSASGALALRPRTKPAGVRREELMDAAQRIFIERGIAATSVDDIAAAADVGKGTLYLHFDSKETLLQALQERFVEQFHRDLQAAIDHRRADDHRGRLRAWIAAGVAGFVDRAAQHDLVFHQFRAEGPRRKHANPIVAQLEQLLTAGLRDRAWLAPSPHATAVMLFAALHGMMDEALAPPHSAPKASARPARPAPIDRERIARTLQTFFYRALGLG
jgi:AcrR family transcriptional regulator